MINIADNWIKKKINTVKQLEDLWNASPPKLTGIDTETDGLFHMTTLPFLVVFGWTPEDKIKNQSTVVVFEAKNTDLVNKVRELIDTVPVTWAHNMKFDLHAMINLENTNKNLKTWSNVKLYDTMTLARLILETKPINEGGQKLGLKALAKEYIQANAGDEEKLIKSYKMEIKRNRRLELENEIEEAGYNRKKWSKVVLEKISIDPVLKEEEELPPVLYKIWKKWTKKYPKMPGLKTVERVTYEDIYNYSPESKKTMLKYAVLDVIWTLSLAEDFWPFIKIPDQTDVFKTEMEAAHILLKSERIGLNIDWDYIDKSKLKMRNYILELRQKGKNILKKKGITSDFSTFASSPKQIKNMLISEGYPKDISTAKEPLVELINKMSDKNITKTLLKNVIEHRALIKKYSTDLLGFEINELNGKRYTTFNMNGTVTGRISNDMQQLPKEGIKNDKGEELFNPRKAVIPSHKAGFNHIIYLDYSQIELRIQAHYTYIATNGEGDKALLRMYIPFKTDPKTWIPTDMHSLTATQAYPEIDPESKEFQKYRSKAKNVNFAMQYGAGQAKVIMMVGDEEAGKRLYEANKKTFPGLVAYSNMIRKDYNRKGYTTSFHNRVYRTTMYTHKLGNYVIQGTASEILKKKLIEVDDFLNFHEFKTRIIHNIHDEIQLELHDSEIHIIEKLKEIMEDKTSFVVPLTVNVEITSTNWNEKEDYECTK